MNYTVTHFIRVVLALAKCQFILRYRNAMLGFFWAVGEPFMFLGVLSIVFAQINKQPLAEYALYLFSGLIPWKFLESTTLNGMESIAGGRWLLTQMDTPAVTFPCVSTVIGVWDLLCTFAVGSVFFLLLGAPAGGPLLVLPFAFLVWLVLANGLAVLSATIFVFVRDIKPIVQMGLMLLFFSSIILNMESNIDPHSLYGQLLRFHPMTSFAHLFQDPLYWKRFPSRADWLISSGIAAGIWLCSAAFLRRVRSKIYFYL
jgi:ABC-type polysaccharide/polyol phosphate export permease